MLRCLKRRRPFQFRLTTMLALFAIVGASLVGYSMLRKWKSDALWRNLEQTKSARDDILRRWQFLDENSNNRNSPEILALRSEYFRASKEAHQARIALYSFYKIEGNDVFVEVRPNGEKILVEYPSAPGD